MCGDLWSICEFDTGDQFAIIFLSIYMYVYEVDVPVKVA